MKRLILPLLLLALALPALAKWDLGIAWIERNEKYSNPKDADGSWNRPQPGDNLTWTANIYSNSEDQSGNVTCYLKWVINTKVEAVHTQTFSKAVGLYQDTLKWTVPANYTYDFSRPLTNKLSVTMTYAGGASDSRTGNNTREIYLDAMTFLVRVYTNTFWQYTSAATPKSFYDNLEDTINFMNGRYEAAKYPLAPYGIIDRYRVDRVELMNEQRDPTIFQGQENYYTKLSYSEGDSYGGYLGNPYDWIGQTFLWSGNGVFSTMGHGAVCHETGHSLCFPDTYRFNMPAEKNKIYNQAWTCDWADPEGKEDIMRYCYNGTKDVFTELQAAVINLHAGEQRRYPPEMHNGKKGWMFSLLPTNICIRLYGYNGRELCGMAVPIYRGTGDAYELAFENTVPSYTPVCDGSVTITPEYSYDNNNIYANCFMVEVPGSGSGTAKYKIIDSLRLNYAYLKGGQETACFSYTNTALKAAEPTSVVLGDGSGVFHSPQVTLHLAYPSNATKVRIAFSEGGLRSAEWLDIAQALELVLHSGKNTIYVQTLSNHGVLSDVYVREAVYADDWDLGLAWLERTPKYGIGKYDIGSRYRPEPGDRLTWTANIYCNTSLTNDPVDVIVDWFVNTKREASHTNSFQLVRAHYQDDFHWTMPDSYVYDFEHPLTNIISARLRYPAGLSDANPSNDVLNVYMDALTFGVIVVDATFDKYTQTSSRSFYDCMNDTIDFMNAQFERGKTQLAPYGIIDRYRVAYLKHQSHQSFNINAPDSTNCTTQLIFNEGGSLGAFYNAPYYWIGQTFSSGIFKMSGHGAVCHEAGHSLQLPDTYRFDLSADNNAVNGKSWHCNWMDPPGKQDIMRYCYEGWDDVFCGISPFMANLQAGVYRRTPPEMYSNAYCNSKGWMFQYLPTSVVLRVYNRDGRELDQLPVTMHRGGGTAYAIQFPNSKYEWWRTYNAGGLQFETDCRCENSRMFENCFLLTCRCTGLPFEVLDVLRLNYLCASQKTTGTVTFSYTNDFQTAEITSLKLNGGAATTDSRDIAISFATDNGIRKTRFALSEEELQKQPWEETATEVGFRLPEEPGTYTVYAQVLSRCFVPSQVRQATIELVPEPGVAALLAALGLLAAARRRRQP